MADQFNDSIPAVTNQITEDVADISETLGFLKDCFEAVCTGWSNADASGLKVDVLADAVTRLTVLQGADVTAAIWRKILNIGDWNMDVTLSVSIAHGLTLSKIRCINTLIRDDADTMYSTLEGGISSTASGFAYADGTNIVLTRIAAGSFDNALYDATSFNRGYIIVEYVS